MSGHFESMVNEMVRWTTTADAPERTPAAEAAESILPEDDDELDLEEEPAPWPGSGQSNPFARKKGRTA